MEVAGAVAALELGDIVRVSTVRKIAKNEVSWINIISLTNDIFWGSFTREKFFRRGQPTHKRSIEQIWCLVIMATSTTSSGT